MAHWQAMAAGESPLGSGEVPLAGWLGQSIGWRWGFALPGFIALLSAWLILKVAPRIGGNPDARPWDELQALRNPRVLWLLAVGAIGFGGFFPVYAFLTAAMNELSPDERRAVAAAVPALSKLRSILAATDR